MPPKRTPSAGNTRAASNFFQHVKKPNTAHARTITSKKNAAVSTTTTTTHLKQSGLIGQQPAVQEEFKGLRKATTSKSDETNEEDEGDDEIDETEFDDDFEEDESANDEVTVAKKQPTAEKAGRVLDEIVLEDSEDELDIPDQQLLGSSDVDEEDEEEEEESLFDIIQPTVAKAAVKKVTVTKYQQQLKQRQQAKNLKIRKEQPVVVPDVGDIHRGFHQSDLSVIEKTLRQFDLAQKYGPCTDITRLERWERAFALGLNPPLEIKNALIAEPSFNKGLFHGRV